MDIYLVDSNTFDRTALIDEYVSMIWTERYAESGDFQLTTLPDRKWQNLLREGRYLRIPQSNRIMEILSAQIKTENGETLYTVTGRTPEHNLENRHIIGGGAYYTDAPASYIISQMLARAYDIGIDITTDDQEPRLINGGQAASDLIDYTIKDGDAYTVIKELADMADIGFAIVPQSDGTFVFSTYSGTVRPQLRFSTELDTLADPSYLRSNAGWKNHAKVYYQPKGALNSDILDVDAPGYNASGFARKTVWVEAKDIDSSKTSYAKYMSMVKRRGIIELAQHKKTRLFTGKTPQDSDLRYNRDYRLGDIGQIQGDSDAMQQQIRVVEYIFSSDAEGDRDYPTFAAAD